MRWVEQPAKKRCCGQVALAVLADLTLEQAIRQVGHDKGTTTKVMARHLRAFGFTCPDRLRACQRPELALAKLTSRPGHGNWHWVVVDGDKIWDGVWGDEHGQVDWPVWKRITSYLPLERKVIDA